MQAADRRSRLLALGRLVARTLRAAADALERNAAPPSGGADPLEPTLARLRLRYPDAPEHWLRFVAERQPADTTAPMPERRAEEDNGGELPAVSPGSERSERATAADAAAPPRRDAVFTSQRGLRRVEPRSFPRWAEPPNHSHPTEPVEPAGDKDALRSAHDARPIDGFRAWTAAVGGRARPAAEISPAASGEQDRPAGLDAGPASRSAPTTIAPPSLPRPRFRPPLPPPVSEVAEARGSIARPRIVLRDSVFASGAGAQPVAAKVRRPEPAANASAERSRPAFDASGRPDRTARVAPPAFLQPPITRASAERHASATPADPARSARRMQSEPTAFFARVAAGEGPRHHAFFAPAEPPWPELPASLDGEAPEQRPPATQTSHEEVERWNALPF